MRITIEFQRPRPGRRRWLIAAAVAALVVPTAAFANHQFTDVPTSHTFHGDISDAKNAGLTSGCSPTTFCPDANLTRAQMTAFLNRGLGRVAQGALAASLSTGTAAPMGTVTIKAGNVTGGTALVFVSASINLYTITAGCPCEMRVDLLDASSSALASYVLADLPAIPSGDSDSDVSLSIQGYATVPTGVDQTFTVRAQRTLGTATLLPYGTVNAIYLPFDANGDAAGGVSPAGEGHPRD
jgi:hypothetical protein